MSPSSGSLLSASALREQLGVALADADSPVSLGSAYLKVSGLEWVARHVKPNIPVRILVRWKPVDLLSGSSDVDAFQFAQSKGWPFFIQQDFHGKVYLINHRALFVGSANLTSRGFNLFAAGNDEINVRAELSPGNYEFVECLFGRAVLVNEKMHTEIKRWVDANKKPFEIDAQISWPKELAKLLRPSGPVETLLVAECFHTNGSWTKEMRDSMGLESVAIDRDLSLIGFVPGRAEALLNSAIIEERVRSTKMYSWLCEQLQKAERRELYFGALTAALHDCLLDDPTPFRSEVKTLLSNLLSWIELSGISEIAIDRPNHSQRVALTSR